MSQPPQNPPDLASTVRIGVIITVALASGIAVFLVVTAFLPPGQGRVVADRWAVKGPITTLALVMGSFVLLTHPFLQDLLVAGRVANLARGPKPTEAELWGTLTNLYLSRLIIGSGLLEGAAFFNAIASWIEGSHFCRVAAILLALALVARLPTQDRAARWIESRRIHLEALQSFES